MRKGNATIISIIVAIVLVAAIAIIWGMQKDAPREEADAIPVAAGEAPLSGTPEEVDQINVEDIESELNGLNQDIEQL